MPSQKIVMNNQKGVLNTYTIKYELLDYEEEILDKLAKEISDEIDKQILHAISSVNPKKCYE